MPEKENKTAPAVLAKNRAWYARNAVHRRLKMQEYRKRNKQQTQASTADWKRRHPERTRAHSLKAHWGMTLEEFEQLLAGQNGGCAICAATVSDGTSRSLHVDHDHVTGKVRGLLCFRCNSLLGKARDSVAVLEGAIAYLKEHS